MVESIAEPEELSIKRSRRQERRRAVLGFVIGALVLLIAAPILARSSEWIAEERGVTATFIGTS